MLISEKTTRSILKIFASKKAYPIVRQLEKITVKKAEVKVVKCTKNKSWVPRNPPWSLKCFKSKYIVYMCTLLTPKNSTPFTCCWFSFFFHSQYIHIWIQVPSLHTFFMLYKVLQLIYAKMQIYILEKFDQGSLKGSQLAAFYPQDIVYCYLEIRLCYFKNLKLFSIRVKR